MLNDGISSPAQPAPPCIDFMKKWIYCLAISGFLSFLFASNSFAASDIVYNYDSSSTFPYTLCSSNCESYKYLYTTCSSLPGYNLYFSMNLITPAGSGSGIVGLFSETVIVQPEST